MTQRWIVPQASDAWALFLDVDGTLIDIAPTPGEVHVDPALPPLLARLRDRFGGALALVSGRQIAVLDGFFAPHRFAAAGIHGLERRDAQGKMHVLGLKAEQLDAARALLQPFATAHPELMLEDKGVSLGLHFRQAPHLEAAVNEIMREALSLVQADVHLQPGHCVVELKSRAANKRTAIATFMSEAPFIGRVPVFLGDDVTDRDGFSYVESVGGHAIFIGSAPEGSRGWLPNPAAVREWLGSLADAAGARGGMS